MGDSEGVPSAILSEAVVLRGGPLQDEKGAEVMYQNAFEEWDASGRWALSVFSWPGWTADQLAAGWRYRGETMQASTTTRLAQAGFPVVPEPRWEGDTHALLMLGDEPTEDTWDRLRPCFGPEMPNPQYRGRQ